VLAGDAEHLEVVSESRFVRASPIDAGDATQEYQKTESQTSRGRSRPAGSGFEHLGFLRYSSFVIRISVALPRPGKRPSCAL